MKNLTLILLSLLMTSCLYTKEAAKRKFCTTSIADTTIIKLDTFITKEVVKDTVFSHDVETVEVVKDKLSIKYVKYRDSVYLQGKCASDTILQTDTLYIQIPVNIPNTCEIGYFDKIKGVAIELIIAFLLGFLICAWIKK